MLTLNNSTLGHYQFTIAVNQICLDCSGSGSAARPDAIISCHTCGGAGIRLVRHQLAPGMFQQVQMHCDACGGRGKITKHVYGYTLSHRSQVSNL
jgi:DnaJ-related protein SCJ1